MMTKARNLSSNLAEDFLQEAITRFLNEKRKWNPDKVKLLPFLIGVIKSIISHYLTSAYNVKRSKIEISDESSDKFIKSKRNTESNTLKILERKDIEEYLLDHTKNDEEMQYVLLCIFDGDKRSEISEELNFPLNKVDNILKRIRRLTKKYLEENK